MPTRTRILVVIGAVVFVGLVVAVIADHEEPTHRVLTAALHGRGCADPPTITKATQAPSGFVAWDRKTDTAWRVDGCGAGHDAVVREHRERTGRKGKHHRDVYEVVFWE